MKIERIERNTFFVENHGNVIVPTGIHYNKNREEWIVSSNLVPDIPAAERRFNIFDYSSPIMALEDAIGTLRYHLDRLWVGRDIHHTPFVNKGNNLIRGVFQLTDKRNNQIFSVYNPLDKKREYYYIPRVRCIPKTCKAIRVIAENRRLQLVDRWREIHAYTPNF